MSLKINITPNKIFSLDCEQVSITNILVYKEYPEVKSIWKDLNIGYHKLEANDLGNLYSSKLSKKDELKWIHGINLKSFIKKSEFEFIDEIKQSLKKLDPVMVVVDIFNLNYHTAFLKIHSSHIITIIGYENGSFHCVDHYQQFDGKLTIEELLKAAKSQDNTMEYLHVDISSAKLKLTIEDYFTVIDSIRHNFAETKQCLHENALYSGINAINEFILECKSYEDDEEQIQFILGDLSNYLGYLSSRYQQFCEFIMHGKDLIQNIDLVQNIDLLIEIGYELAQELKVISNMSMKAEFKNTLQMYKRIILKLDEYYLLAVKFMDFLLCLPTLSNIKFAQHQ